MFAQVHYPESLSGGELDEYLREGWFRNAQRIFTTNFLNFDNQLYSAIWLRVDLKTIEINKTFKKLSKQNSGFKTTIQPASITAEKEELFQRYKSELTFNASQSLQALLYGEGASTIFNTHEILLHDNDKLIAVGFFDLGKQSAAGIISFYDQSYKKFSLGKYLIMLKMNYCKQLQFEYFYPGYFAPNYRAFDYKLTIGRESLSYLQLKTNSWVPINDFCVSNNPYTLMINKLKELELLLNQQFVPCSLNHYTYFEANIIPNLQGLHLFDFPVFLFCFEEQEDVVNPMIVYDIINNCYHLIECKSVWKADEPVDEDGFYSTHLLKLKKHVCSTIFANEMAQLISHAVQENINSPDSAN